MYRKNKKFDINFIYNKYTNLYTQVTGADLNEDEKQFFIIFCDNGMSNAPVKNLYFNSLYRFQKKYPRFLIRHLLIKELSMELHKNSAPSSITNNIFQKAIFEEIYRSAFNTYCKNQYSANYFVNMYNYLKSFFIFFKNLFKKNDKIEVFPWDEFEKH